MQFKKWLKNEGLTAPTTVERPDELLRADSKSDKKDVGGMPVYSLPSKKKKLKKH